MIIKIIIIIIIIIIEIGGVITSLKKEKIKINIKIRDLRETLA